MSLQIVRVVCLRKTNVLVGTTQLCTNILNLGGDLTWEEALSSSSVTVDTLFIKSYFPHFGIISIKEGALWNNEKFCIGVYKSNQDIFEEIGTLSILRGVCIP